MDSGFVFLGVVGKSQDARVTGSGRIVVVEGLLEAGGGFLEEVHVASVFGGEAEEGLQIGVGTGVFRCVVGELGFDGLDEGEFAHGGCCALGHDVEERGAARELCEMGDVIGDPASLCVEGNEAFGVVKGVGDSGIELGFFVGAGGALCGLHLGDVVSGEGAFAPEGAGWGAGAAGAGVESVDGGVSVSGASAGEVGSSVETAPAVGAVGFEDAGDPGLGGVGLVGVASVEEVVFALGVVGVAFHGGGVGVERGDGGGFGAADAVSHAFFGFGDFGDPGVVPGWGAGGTEGGVLFHGASGGREEIENFE